MSAARTRIRKPRSTTVTQVRILERKCASYSRDTEEITFVCVYANGGSEWFVDTPFASGADEGDLKQWAEI